jgi:hypothetical protein
MVLLEFGTATSAIVFGGESLHSKQKLWNGTNWAEVNNLNTERQQLQQVVEQIIQTGLAFGGNGPPA